MAETGQIATILAVMAQTATAFAGQVSQWITTIFTSGNEMLVFSITMPLATVGLALLSRIVRRARV